MDQLWTSTTFKLVILPLLIVLARMTDVSLGTLRIIFISRGFKLWATLVGFFEICVWLLAITQIMNNLNNIYYYLAYASGYALGTFTGLTIENRLAMGMSLIRVILPCEQAGIIEELKKSGWGFTYFPAHGAFNPVNVIFALVKRKQIFSFLNLLKNHCPDAVYTIEDIRTISKQPTSFLQNPPLKALGVFRRGRKGK